MQTLQHPHRSEFSYLREQRAQALNEIQSTLTSLGAALKEQADPRRLAATHPWATAGTAFGLGLAAGYVVMPSKPPQSPPAPAAAPFMAGTPAEPAAGTTSTAGAEPNAFRDKLTAGAKSMVIGAAYGLGRLALNQILDGLMAGMQPPADPADDGPEFASDPPLHAESFAWQPETRA